MDKEHPRLVSLVPSWTETLFRFGFDAEVVGVTRWCVHPRELMQRVPKVGGTKDPDVAAIAALKPDLVVCEKEENRREDVDALRARGIPVWTSDVRDVGSSLRDILSLGDAVGRPEAARALADEVEAALREVAAARGPDVPVYCPIWRRPWMTPTADTYAHHVLAACGARNVFAQAEGRYPERGPEEALEAGARAVLLPTEPYPFHDKLDAALDELEEAGFPRERVHLVDGEALTWYGAREPWGIREVARTVGKLHK